MLSKNEVYKLPPQLKWYQLSYLILIIFLISLPFAFINSFTSTFITLSILIGLPIFFFTAWGDRNVSFVFDYSKLAINTGIFSRESKIIPYDKVQNIKIKSGLLSSMFGLSRVSIWTASPDQAVGDREEARPNGFLILSKGDAQLLSSIALKSS